VDALQDVVNSRNRTQDVGQEENLEDKILQMIAENNKVTKKEIAQALGVSEKMS
jgi:predicted HTH transcriptional regulator